jgi:hypothetical protein
VSPPTWPYLWGIAKAAKGQARTSELDQKENSLKKFMFLYFVFLYFEPTNNSRTRELKSTKSLDLRLGAVRTVLGCSSFNFFNCF